MKPHPRIRKTVKWGGAAVLLLVVAVWLGSAWLRADWQYDRCFVSVRQGRVFVARFDLAFHILSAPGFRVQRNSPYGLVWAFQIEWESSDFYTIGVPLWALFLFTFPAPAIAWRLDALARRRARLNLCPKCHYDRTGLAAGAACPECGSPPA